MNERVKELSRLWTAVYANLGCSSSMFLSSALTSLLLDAETRAVLGSRSKIGWLSFIRLMSIKLTELLEPAKYGLDGLFFGLTFSRGLFILIGLGLRILIFLAFSIDGVGEARAVLKFLSLVLDLLRSRLTLTVRAAIITLPDRDPFPVLSDF